MTIGGVVATGIVVVNATTITATTPPGVAGAQRVVVTAAGVPSIGTPQFAYIEHLLDIDDNGSCDALTDGLLVMRSLRGLSGAGLIAGAVGPQALRSTPEAITGYLASIALALDIDGNTQNDPLTDGLLVMRYLFGLRGDALIGGAFDPSGIRTTAPAIETYLDSLCDQLLVVKGNQTINYTSTAPAGAMAGGATYTVSATASSPLAVAFTIDPVAASVCSISGSTVSFVGPGTCVIDANQAGNANYNAAPQVQQSFAVTGPAFAATKLVSTDNGVSYVSSATAPSGAALIFRIVTTNSGTAAGNAVSFNDAVPPLLTYVPGSGKFATAANTNYAAATALTEGSGGYAFSANTVAYSPGAPAGTVAAAGGVLVLFFKATIAGAPVNTQITNTATVGYKDTGGNAHAPINASADVTVTTVP